MEQQSYMVTNAQELKPCPFCGGEATLWGFTEDDGNKCFKVFCGNGLSCHVQVSTNNFYTMKGAIEAWNRRVGE